MRARWIAYDWFKLIVLLILIALLLLFVAQNCPCQTGYLRAAAQDGTAQTDASSGANAAAAAPDAKVTADAAAAMATADAAAAATAAQPAATAEPGAAADAQNGDQTAATSAAADLSAVCEKALPVRLSGADVRARVTNATLTLRSRPEVANNVLGFMPAGTEVDVIALPVCTPYLEGANNWWRVTTAAGTVGFAAEGSAVNPVYYLEEIR
jgi:hypothetical protein